MKSTRRHRTHGELNDLLDQVESGFPADAVQLKLLLAKNKLNLNDFAYFYGWPLNDLSVSRSPNDIEGWNTWRQMVVGRKVDLSNIITAAATGNSHSVRKELSMVTYWPENEK